MEGLAANEGAEGIAGKGTRMRKGTNSVRPPARLE